MGMAAIDKDRQIDRGENHRRKYRKMLAWEILMKIVNILSVYNFLALF